MADKITTFSEETCRYILRELDALKSRQNFLLSGGLTQSFPQGVLPTRWARTCTSPESPTYPTTGNVVAVEFGDYEPSPLSAGSTATKTFTAYDPQVSVLATGDNSPLPFQGQVVPVVWRNGKWWYLHPNFRRATADSSISAGTSGQVSLFDDTTDMGSRTAYYTWGDSGGATISSGAEIFVAWFDAEQKWIILPTASSSGSSARARCSMTFSHRASSIHGNYAWRDGAGALAWQPVIGWDGSAAKQVKLFPVLEGATSNASGTVYVVKSQSGVTAYSDDWLTLKQNGWHRVIWTGSFQLAPASSSEANAQLRDAGHTHTYSGGTTGSSNAGATALTRMLGGISAVIHTGVSWPPVSYSYVEWIYNSSYPTIGQYTVIGAFERTNSTGDIPVNLILSQYLADSTDMRMSHLTAHVTVEQTSDS